MSNAMSFKAKIRNIAKDKNIPAQVIMQNYMFERLLTRLSLSNYKDKFVIKGGMLVAAIVGLDNRATMDLDTTLKNLPLTPEAIRSALEEIISIQIDDEVSFEIGDISPQVLKMNFPGCFYELEELANYCGFSNGFDFIEHTEYLLEKFNIDRKLSNHGLQESDLAWVVKNSRSGSMRANPRDFSDEELTALLMGML